MNPKREVPFDFSKVASSYKCPHKGLRKEIINFKYQSMTKATEISKCLVTISDVNNLRDRESKHLIFEENKEFWIELGTALTAIDYYIELFLQQMFENETSRCYIKTKSSEEISFTMKLIQIEFKGYIFELNLKEVFELAQKYKENGVIMFKKYPKFAQEYFCRGAKCLISFKPFDDLTEKRDGVSSEQLNKLLQNLQLNISACLIKEKRFEDVIHLTSFVEESQKNCDKAIYRRAVALYNLKKFEEAKYVIEKLENYKSNQELVNLHTKILNDWKADNQNYKEIVQKMFG